MQKTLSASATFLENLLELEINVAKANNSCTILNPPLTEVKGNRIIERTNLKRNPVTE